MIAGPLGLLLGKQSLNILPFSGGTSSYADVLIIIIFAVVVVNGFTTSKEGGKGDANLVIGFQLYRLAAFPMQFFIPVILAFIIYLKKMKRCDE